MLHQYYQPSLSLCYEHLTRGPCQQGLLFTYNHTRDTTQCTCSPDLPNYSPAHGECFELDSKGPCGKGQVFVLDAERKQPRCECKENYVYWPAAKACFREFTPGPCSGPSQFIIRDKAGLGVCSDNPCPKTDLFFPAGDGDNRRGECHKVGSRGPCADGELVVFETYSGKSYRGSCGCSVGYNQNYWPGDQRCYEWYSQGPCNNSFVFKYNRLTRATECACDTGSGLVFWAETEGCYRPYTQGPCPDNSWLIPAAEDEEVYCECRDGYHFEASDYSCHAVDTIHPPSPPGSRFQGLWTNVAEYVERSKKKKAEKEAVTSGGGGRRRLRKEQPRSSLKGRKFKNRRRKVA